MILQLKNVSWIAGKRRILHNIDWLVNEGEHWAILGLNGSGKTSLLKMINGYVWPSMGEINVLGENFGDCDVRELRKKIGWVSSSLQEHFYPNETAMEIVMSGRNATIGLYDMPGKREVARAQNLLNRLQCRDVGHQLYGTLSQGEKQKVLIARALFNSPSLLVLDEPCVGLDLYARERILAILADLATEESTPTLLYVSHHIEEMLPEFTHALLLKKGRIHSSGRKKEVLTCKNLSDFLGMPAGITWRNGRPWVTL